MSPANCSSWKSLLLLLFTFFQYSSSVTISTNAGELKGSETKGAFTGRTIFQFRGVPFAEPPSGSLRFKAPVPVRPWTGVKDATEWGQECPSPTNIDSLLSTTKDPEDCLHLSIYSTNLTSSRPVMIFFHGGGFYEGSSLRHPPNYLLEEDIVLVVPQYRLGTLGLLSTMTEEIPGNAGLLDCVLALQWVNENIHHFGGDPRRVTIFGQSAGAMIVNSLMLSPIVPKNLFHGAILQSASALGPWVVGEKAEEKAKEISQLGSCSGSSTVQEVNQCLLNMDVKTLTLAYHSFSGCCRMVLGGPTNFLPEKPFQLMKRSENVPRIPLMAGVTKHEGSYILVSVFQVLNDTLSLDNFTTNPLLWVDRVLEMAGLGEYSDTPLSGWEFSQLLGEDRMMMGNVNFTRMTEVLVDILSVSGIKDRTFRAAQLHWMLNAGQTFLYSFDYRGEFTRFGYGENTSGIPFSGGVHHSDDNMYLFPWPEFVLKLNERDTRMAKQMVKLWSSFAINGKPELEEWKPMSRLNGPYLHINEKMKVGENLFDEYSVTVREGLNGASGRMERGWTMTIVVLGFWFFSWFQGEFN